jgi:hypothetical protein
MEIKDIPGYEGLYRISDEGQVFRVGGAEMKGSVNSYGYRVDTPGTLPGRSSATF